MQLIVLELVVELIVEYVDDSRATNSVVTAILVPETRSKLDEK